MKLFSGERAVAEAPTLRLTSHRVRREGADSITSITLDAVVSCQVLQESNDFLLILAIVVALAGLVGFFAAGQEAVPAPALVFGFLLAGLFFLLYMRSKKTYLTIASAGQSIRVLIQGHELQETTEFIDQVELAKMQLMFPSAFSQSA